MNVERIKELEKILSNMGRTLVKEDGRIRPGHAMDWRCDLPSGKSVSLVAYSYEAALAGSVLLLDDPLPADMAAEENNGV